MKIALTTDSFIEGHGGVSTAVAALARTLPKGGHQVMVYAAFDPRHEHIDLDVVGLRALHYERFPGGRAPMAPIALVQELADFNPDVIHNHSMGTMGIQALAAMARLRQAGVPFGVSLTATRHNAEEILSDEFIDFCFEEQGALYGWLFHYMPIGRSFTLDLMPTPEQRKWMWQRTWEIIRQRHIFLADFWNHGTLSDGCIAGGRTRGRGYLYIDWNGAVSPCVFVPYSPVNVNDVYAKGGTLNDIWAEPFFAGIRGWQENYWQGKGNWLAPCIIRDHHTDLRRLIAQHEPDPTDESARIALLDPDYARGLEEYDEQYQTLSGPLWEMHYLSDKKRWDHDKEQ